MHLQLRYALACFGIGVVSCGLTNTAEAGFLSRLVARSVAVGAGQAVAHAAPSTSSRPDKTYDATTLTLPQLESCVTRAKTLDDQSAGLDSEKTEIDRLAEAVKAGKDSVEAQRVKLSRSDAKAVAKFNRVVDAQNDAVRKYNSEVTQAKSHADAFNSSARLYNEDCGNRYYYVDDMNKVKVKLGLN